MNKPLVDIINSQNEQSFVRVLDCFMYLRLLLRAAVMLGFSGVMVLPRYFSFFLIQWHFFSFSNTPAA